MKAGDRILLTTKDEEIEGIFMPCVDDTIIMLKLDNGYNIGVPQKDVKKTKVLKVFKTKKSSVKKAVQKKSLPHISLLHTGGTIASKVDYTTGGTMAQFTPEDLLDMFPELKEKASISSRLVANMWSEDLRFAHYNLLAKEVAKEIKKGAEGIIITHGTDTMHYTSAALAFILENLHIPVLLVGAQRSSDRPSSDAASNLLAAVEFITKTNFKGTGIVMHETMQDAGIILIPGLKARKMHTSSRGAFRPINAKPFARLMLSDWKITQFEEACDVAGKLKILPFKEDLKVGVLSIHTNMFAEEFLAYKNFDGLVIAGTGIAGNMPINVIDAHTKEHEKIYKALVSLAKKMPIVACAQTIFGRLNMNVYTTGHRIQQAGILGNHLDIAPDTAFIKLAWLLSNYPKEKIGELYHTNLRGEISQRLKPQYC